MTFPDLIDTAAGPSAGGIGVLAPETAPLPKTAPPAQLPTPPSPATPAPLTAPQAPSRITPLPLDGPRRRLLSIAPSAWEDWDAVDAALEAGAPVGAPLMADAPPAPAPAPSAPSAVPVVTVPKGRMPRWTPAASQTNFFAPRATFNGVWHLYIYTPPS